MKIGELAAHAGCDTPTIRYYEKEGLLREPPRTDAGYREYNAIHVDQLNFIRHCRSVGITLSEIKTLQYYQADPSSACLGVNTLLDQHINKIHQQIESMRRLEQQLLSLRDSCQENHTVSECGILQSLMSGADDCACHAASLPIE